MAGLDADQDVSFASPPVVEVVAAVALAGLHGPEVGPLLASYWRERLKVRYPRLEPQAPYLPPIEEFPSPNAFSGLQWSIGVPPTRLWALTQDGGELLQLQPGWFACNWRKVLPHDEYDRWSVRRESFSRWYRDLMQFLVSEGINDVRITQCEVTYINHIQSGAVWGHHGHLSRVIDVNLGTPTPYRLEQLVAEAQFLMEDAGGPYGRVHAKILPAFDQDGRTPLYVLELTARGAPLGEGLVGALQFMDNGRHAINSLFVAMTTKQMHEEWRRQS